MNGLTEKTTVPPSVLVVLEGNGLCKPNNTKITVHWDKTSVSPDQISLPAQIESRVLEIKKEFLAWCYEVSQVQIDGENVTEHLKIFDGLSFWWMTLMGEKSPYKCPAIYNVFKLRALERIYKNHDCQGIVFCGVDPILGKVLSRWCAEMGHSYTKVRVAKKTAFPLPLSLKHLSKKLPYFLQACIWLVYKWWTRYRHLNSPRLTPSVNTPQVTLVTYFPNIDREKTGKGRFWSRYWEDFHSLLDRLPFGVHWVWVYFKQNEINFREAVRLRDVCNEVLPDKYQHHLLEEFLTPKSLLQAICLYLKIYRKGKQLNKLQGSFVFPGSKLNFFPFFKTDWESSFFGSVARDEALRIALFDAMALTLPPGPFGMFTWENQGWELGLVSAWRRHRKNMSVFGYVHSSVRPLDLCMFSDPKTYKGLGVETHPLPDRLAVGTSSGLSLLEQSGYPEENLIGVEALRYMSLMGCYRRAKKSLKSTGRILVVASGMINHETPIHFAMLADAARLGGLEKYDDVIIKQHPAYPLDDVLAGFDPPFSYNISTESMDSLWSFADVVYCPNPSSIGLEAAWLGVPVIFPSSVNALNLGPLYGLPELEYVTNSDMLVEKLNDPAPVSITEDYFFFDRDLTRWKNFLDIK